MRGFFAAMVVSLVAVTSAAWAADGDPAPEPKPAFGKVENDLPLETYRELKRMVDAARGIQTPGAEKLGEDAAKAALTAAAKRNTAMLVKALNASQVIHRQLAAVVLSFSKEKESKAAVPHAQGATVEDSFSSPKEGSEPGRALAEALAVEPDVDVRRALCGALLMRKDATSADALIRALKDDDKMVRSMAAQALGEIKDNRAVAPLLEVLGRDEDAMIRMRAASALSSIGEAAAVEPLLKAMDSEKDQRVRMAIAGAVRKIRGQDTPATQGVPSAQEHENVLLELAGEMKGVEDRLRDDRHDQAVQVDQKTIEDKLSKIIEMIQKMESQQSQSQGQQKKESGEKQKREQSGQKPSQPSSPLADSKLGETPQRGALRPGEVSGIQDRWAKLPAHLREEMLQVYREEMPERWKKRLEAYYMSVAAEQNKE